MQIAIPLYDNVTALDAVGPYEILARLPGAEVIFVGAELRSYVTDTGMLRLPAEASLDDVRAPDIVCVPGGVPIQGELAGPIVPWIRNVHATTTWTTSVCTGSLLLGAAGVLQGLRATSHWMALDHLRGFGAEPTGERVVRDGRVVTAAGVSSGIDMALLLAGQIAGDATAKEIQLGVEYDPQPPYDAGAPGKATPAAIEAVRTQLTAQEMQGGARRA